jgi:hypothetical protein
LLRGFRQPLFPGRLASVLTRVLRAVLLVLLRSSGARRLPELRAPRGPWPISLLCMIAFAPPYSSLTMNYNAPRPGLMDRRARFISSVGSGDTETPNRAALLSIDLDHRSNVPKSLRILEDGEMGLGCLVDRAPGGRTDRPVFRSEFHAPEVRAGRKKLDADAGASFGGIS